MFDFTHRSAALDFAGYVGTWQAARVEVTQQHEAAERELNPVEDRVVERIVERTALEPAPANN